MPKSAKTAISTLSTPKQPPLFAAAAEVGGVIADAQDAEQKALTAYGRNLGIAFQLVDDALDYGSINRVLGKNIGEDFAEGKVTLPVILAYHRGDAEAREFWEEAVKNPNNDGENFARALAPDEQNRCAGRYGGTGAPLWR